MLSEIPFKELPSDVRDAVALVQRQLRDAVSALDTRVTQLAREAKARRSTAIVLKLVTVVTGIVIATGFLQDGVVQVLGAVVPTVIAVERIFANLNRLLSVTAAKNAYQRIRRQVESTHNSEIINVVRVRDRVPEDAADKLIAFVGELRDMVAKSRDEIEDKLSQNDYDSLGRLSLEDEVAVKS